MCWLFKFKSVEIIRTSTHIYIYYYERIDRFASRKVNFNKKFSVFGSSIGSSFRSDLMNKEHFCRIIKLPFRISTSR